MKTFCSIVLAFLTATLFVPADAFAAQGGVSIGELVCRTLPGSRQRQLLASKVQMKCTFRTERGSERYKGELGNIGIELGEKGVETLRFSVVGLTTNIKIGAHSLQGQYVGGTAGFGLGGGSGGIAQFVGTGNLGFNLVPIGFQSGSGPGIFANVSRMTLLPDK